MNHHLSAELELTNFQTNQQLSASPAPLDGTNNLFSDWSALIATRRRFVQSPSEFPTSAGASPFQTFSLESLPVLTQKQSRHPRRVRSPRVCTHREPTTHAQPHVHIACGCVVCLLAAHRVREKLLQQGAILLLPSLCWCWWEHPGLWITLWQPFPHCRYS